MTVVGDAEMAPYWKELLSRAVEPAATLFAVQTVCSEKVRKQSLEAFGKLVDAHMLATGVIGSALLRVNGKIVELQPNSEQLGALLAGFVIGMELCERSIVEGQYLQAGALLRQELETVDAINEVNGGTRVHGRKPKLWSLDPSVRRFYDELSAAAHVSKHHIVRSATEYSESIPDASGLVAASRYYPAFDAHTGRRMYALHIYLVMHAGMQLGEYLESEHGKGLTDHEKHALNGVVELLVEEKCLEMVDTP